MKPTASRRCQMMRAVPCASIPTRSVREAGCGRRRAIRSAGHPNVTAAPECPAPVHRRCASLRAAARVHAWSGQTGMPTPQHAACGTGRPNATRGQGCRMGSRDIVRQRKALRDRARGREFGYRKQYRGSRVQIPTVCPMIAPEALLLIFAPIADNRGIREASGPIFLETGCRATLLSRGATADSLSAGSR